MTPHIPTVKAFKKIYAYGDSFVAGDQDIPGRVDAIAEHMEFNRYNISFASVLAKKLGAELINRGISGCSNFVQLDQLWVDSEHIQPDDLVIFGFSTPWRDRFIIPHAHKSIIAPNTGPCILNSKLFADEDKRIAVVDFFYTLSVIEKLEAVHGFGVVKFNSFHNVFTDPISPADLNKFKFDRFIGLHTPGNTLLDVLTDNWGNPIPRISDHSKWRSEVNRHLFTARSHPNVQGHNVIADWLHKQLITNNWI